MDLDFSISPSLPLDVQDKLNSLIQDYKDENLTVKGYQTKRKRLLDRYKDVQLNFPARTPTNIDRKHTIHIPGRNQSLSSTLRERSIGRFSPNASINNLISLDNFSIISPTKSRYNYYNNVTTPQSMYNVTTNSSIFNTPTRPSAAHKRASSIQLSLPSHDVSNDSSNYLPMIPLLPRNTEKQISSVSASPNNPLPSSLLPILRGRFEHNEGQTAIIALGLKGKETYITWDKLYLKAEKVAHELKKSKLYKMDKLLLWYNKEEVIDFTVALLGCFIAGMIAVPISFETYSLQEIVEIIKQTNCKCILISNECYKQLDNLHSTTHNTTIKLNRNEMFKNITFLKTDDLGTYSKAKKQVPTFDISNIAYIEFTRTPLGRLSGVVMKHNILMDQFNSLSDILDSKKMPFWKKSHIRKPYDKKIPLTLATKEKTSKFVIMNILDPTRSTGLIFGVLFNIFSGNLLITVDERLLQKPAGYEYLIDKYRADILLNDQLQLKQNVINYLENPIPMSERKKHKMNFNCVKVCLTSCNTVDTDVTDMVIHKWLKNLGCTDALLCYSPILTLIDFGGIFISTRDQLGGLDNFPIHNSSLKLQDDIYVNKDKLKANTIEASLTAMVNSTQSFNDYIRLESFGYPIPNTTLCVVNPDDATLVPDLCVGEIWLSSNNLINEFYQMDKVNDFVFKAKLNYSKMFSFVNEGSKTNITNSIDRLETIYNVCPPNTQFLRTKLMGFIHNGKIYILSLIEDMFLQNKLIRLPNWSHTSDISKALKSSSQNSVNSSTHGSETLKTTSSSDSSNIGSSENCLLPKYKGKRIVETHYLQQITETLVRTVNTVSDVSAFELNHYKDEHFLILVVESSLAKVSNSASLNAETSVLAVTNKQKEVLEKKMNELTDQICRILWIFHKIQPMCIAVVGRGSLPRRYCSLELANSTVEKKFINSELDSKYVKFQFDNIILDFIPHSGYYNESIFSEHLSKLRRSYIEEKNVFEQKETDSLTKWQTSGIDYRETAYDIRAPQKKMSDFGSILKILEWRVQSLPNESAFTDGGNTASSNSSNNENNIHKNVSWKSFDLIVAAFIKKIVGSKTPLFAGDKVVIMCDNSVEYVAMVMACFYCNLIVIPLKPISEKKPDEDLKFLSEIVKGYKVKRIFVDGKLNNLLSNHNVISKIFKQYKHFFPKVTSFTKLKKKSGIHIGIFKSTLKQRHSYKVGTNVNTAPSVIWVDSDRDVVKNIHVTMNQESFLNICKVLKETLQLKTTTPIFSLDSHTSGLGFLLSCFIGIYVGTATNLFSISNVMNDPKDFLIAVQNMSVTDLYFRLDTFHKIIYKASSVFENDPKLPRQKSSGKSKHSMKSNLSPNLFRNVKNIMISFIGRPSFLSVENLLARYNKVTISPRQINFVYQHHFNPIVSLRSYLDIPPIDMYLDPVSLREGIIKEVDPTSSKVYNALRLQDSGVVPVCTDVTIVNPETLMPCLEGEIGEIWCCSEANVFDYSIFNPTGKSKKDPFITEQFQSKFNKECENGLTYLRTGDLGFIRNIESTNIEGNFISLNLLYVLGSINETIEILGLTHFVSDLEKTVKSTHKAISNCLIAKAGGLLVCLIQTRPGMSEKYGNLTALVVSELMNNHGVVLDMVSFVKNSNISNRLAKYDNWNVNRSFIVKDWFNQDIDIETQFAVNYGENISMYLLSDFEKND